MKIARFAGVNKFLRARVPTMRGFYTLERMNKLMSLLGNPQNNLKVIHVAGTAGKTSTCYYISKMLELSNKKVGLSVSPHILEVNERLQINNQPMEEAKFCELFTEFLQINGVLDLDPTYFELLVAFVYWAFERESVDYAVMEVGLGGLLDGTNVVDRKDKVCVISTIDYDHTHILGESLGEIAFQKAGIITPGNEVFSAVQQPEAMQTIEKVAQEKHATLHVLKKSEIDKVKFDIPLFQKRNWALAHKVCTFVAERDKLKPLGPKLLEQSTKIEIPGRMQIMKKGAQTYILDGAHNPAKFEMLVKSLQEKFPKQKMSVIFGSTKSKLEHVPKYAKTLEPIASSFILTTFQPNQDLPHEVIHPAQLAKELGNNGEIQVVLTTSPEEALEAARKSSSKVVLVTGSLYLLGPITKLLLNE